MVIGGFRGIGPKYSHPPVKFRFTRGQGPSLRDSGVHGIEKPYSVHQPLSMKLRVQLRLLLLLKL